MTSPYRLILFIALASLLPSSQAAEDFFRSDNGLTDQPDFLPVDEAFQVTAQLTAENRIQLVWDITDAYYLYRHRLLFSSTDDGLLGEAEIPDGLVKHDDYFGEVEVYYQELNVKIPFASGVDHFPITVEYQGCADAGLCYPPTRKVFQLAANDNSILQPVAALASIQPAASASDLTSETEEGRLAVALAGGSVLSILLIFFLAGIGLAFTPCVLPMVPILSSIIVGRRATPTRLKAFTLSLTYVLGMAVTYALLGTLVGYFGAELNIQAKLQSTLVLSVFALIFVLLSLSLFGLYELQLPEGLRDRLNNLSQSQEGGEYVGVASMGVVSSLVVSPCVSAPLAGALVYISSTGDALLGGSALLALGLGMGMPLLVIGSSGGDLLPRAGSWMNAVKVTFGVMLLGVAIWLLERILPGPVTLLLWAALLIGFAVYLARGQSAGGKGWRLLPRAGAAVAMIYGVILTIGAVNGADDPLRPLHTLAYLDGDKPDHTDFIQVHDLASLRQTLDQAQQRRKPVMFDFYADWCVSCKVMERHVFSDPLVRQSLAQFDLVQIDVTANSTTDQAVLTEFGLFGPPSILFFDARGSELKKFRIQGEMSKETFLPHVKKVLLQAETYRAENVPPVSRMAIAESD
jgi:thiol:disulfide interchange protein DsbD